MLPWIAIGLAIVYGLFFLLVAIFDSLPRSVTQRICVAACWPIIAIAQWRMQPKLPRATVRRKQTR